MRTFLCFLSLFFLSGLIMASMDSVFLTDIFGKASRSIPIIFGLSILYLIRDYFKDIKGRIFWALYLFSVLFYIILIIVFVD